MSVDLQSRRVNVMEYEGKDHLLSVVRGARAGFYDLIDGLTPEQWGAEIVQHVYMGPIPAFIYIGFQLMDYTTHSWDIRAGLGLTSPIPVDQAGALIPFMFYVLLPSTIDPAEAGFDATWGVRVSGDDGGSWVLTLAGGKLSAAEGGLAGQPVVFNFDPSDFVLTCFQRVSGGAAIGDQDLARRIRRLWFKI